MRILLRNVRWVYSGGELLEHGQVLVTDGRIESVQQGPIEPAAEARFDEIVDLEGCLLIPGLISLHHHFFQHLTRAFPGAHRAAAEDWLLKLYPVWGEMTTQDIAAAARNAAAELLLSGTTTCADHAFLLGDRGDERLAAQVDAVLGLGLRMHLVRSGLPGIGGRVESRLSSATLQSLVDEQGPWLAQCRTDLRRWHDAASGAMLRLDLGPSNIPYDKPALMRACAELAAEYGCGLHAHYHPRPAERDLCRRLNGMAPIDFLEAAGWLRPGTWFAHCTELDDGEIERFAARGVGIVHCPRTVLRLGYRMPRLHLWRRAGIRVGIGADGAASNDGGAFISDVRLAMLLHRAGGPDAQDWLDPQDVLAMATRDAAAILRRPELGAIAAGMCADLAAFDLSGLDCAGSLQDPLAGFLLAGSQPRAMLTMVNGRIRVREGRLVVDERRIAEETNARSRALSDRARRSGDAATTA
jgi:cytosine/adenosine deaminase-related metal-dependent hydrolase